MRGAPGTLTATVALNGPVVALRARWQASGDGGATWHDIEVPAGYQREYLGEFPEPDPLLEHAVNLWLGYYDACEAFDRSVCPDQGRDGVLPATGWEQSEVTRNAGREYKRLMERAAGIPGETLQRAKDIALRQRRP